MTHPGVGPLTALTFVLIIGTAERFQCGKQIGSYVGLIPSEDSSAGQQRVGHIINPRPFPAQAIPSEARLRDVLHCMVPQRLIPGLRVSRP
jgi:transposase